MITGVIIATCQPTPKHATPVTTCILIMHSYCSLLLLFTIYLILYATVSHIHALQPSHHIIPTVCLRLCTTTTISGLVANAQQQQ